MKKLLVGGVLGLTLMLAAGTQAANAAVWRGGYRGHVYSHPTFRTVYNPYNHVHAARPYGYTYGYGHTYGHRFGFYDYDRCW